jgi:hypothetical protein
MSNPRYHAPPFAASGENAPADNFYPQKPGGPQELLELSTLLQFDDTTEPRGRIHP